MIQLQSLSGYTIVTGTLTSVSDFVASGDAELSTCECVVAIDDDATELARWERDKDGRLVRCGVAL